MEHQSGHRGGGAGSGPPTDYRLSLTMRIVVILLVVVAAILTTLGVLPLARLLGVNPQHLQGAGFRPTFGTMTVGILYSASQFVLIWLAMRFIHRRPFSSLGFRRPFWRFLLVGSAVGVGLAVAEIGTNCLLGGGVSIAGNVPPEASAGAVVGYFLLWFLFLLTLNSLKEELLFRTYPIEQFNDHPRAILWVLLFVSLIFAGVHHVIEPFRISAFLSRFSIALLFAYAYYRWRSIWLVVGIHNGTNFVGFLLGGHWKSGGALRTGLSVALLRDPDRGGPGGQAGRFDDHPLGVAPVERATAHDNPSMMVESSPDVREWYRYDASECLRARH